MTAFFYTLNSLLNNNDITKNKFLNDLKLDENSFTEWESHGIVPNGNILLDIALYFDVSVDYLLAYYNYPSLEHVKLLNHQNDIYNSARRYYSEKFQQASLPENPKRIVIDTETTGLNSDADEILQLSIIDENAETLYNQYFNPQRVKSWCDAQAINGISPEMVKNCPPIWKERSKIQSIIESADIIIGYNTSFDIDFLFFAEVFSTAKIVDVMEDFAEIYGEWNDYFDSYKWQKLSDCAEYYKYNWKNDKRHDSLAACRAILHCYKEMQKNKHE